MRRLSVALAAVIMAVAACAVDEQPRPVENGKSVELAMVDAQGTIYVLVPVHIRQRGHDGSMPSR
ncbi:hypothetical protein [Nonomuraea candida]|uniref:hypothetical protein n=1 Tax=Nonomuraea candida TaxID=359159 RepID=UPI0005BDE14D|nr:hypothetical protein [Nonomuraea candida]